MPSIGGVAAQIALLLRVPDFDSYDLSSVTDDRHRRRTVAARDRPRGAPAVRRGLLDPLLVDGVRRRRDRRPRSTRPTRRRCTRSAGRGPASRCASTRTAASCLLRSPAVMTGYWRDPERTAATLVDGWLHTGDLAEDGRQRLPPHRRPHDRHVHPRRLQRASRKRSRRCSSNIPSVCGGRRRAASARRVRRDRRRGRRAVGRRRPAPTLEELRTFGAARLASYKLPESIVVVDSLPLTTMDKLDRRGLRRSVADVGGTGDKPYRDRPPPSR